MFTREELIEIRERAESLAREKINPLWQRAYLALADAADKLDAMEARTIITKQIEQEESKDG